MKILRGKDKSKKKSKDQIFVNFVLDETGSMRSCRAATISGFNEYIKTLKKDQPSIKFSLTKFNSNKTEVVHSAVSIKKVAQLNRTTYVPDALTPLYDAIATTITSMENKAKGKPVLCVIMTDGQENHSKEYNRDKIFKLIKKKEKEGWTFTYLGANQDAWAEARALGFYSGNVTNYSTSRMVATFDALAQTTKHYVKSGGEQTMSLYEDADVKEADITDDSKSKKKKK